MKLLDSYLSNQKKLFDYFGYVEDWVAIPIDDQRGRFWILNQEASGHGTVRFADTLEDLKGDGSNYYENEIYTQRFLPKWVYPGKDYTMICVDTRVDGNKFLQIFENSKRVEE